jgi:excisionase family DNA binding protein
MARQGRHSPISGDEPSDLRQTVQGDHEPRRADISREQPKLTAPARSVNRGALEYGQRDRHNAFRSPPRTIGTVPDRAPAAGSEASNRLLTVAQAAELCQISERQLHRMIRDGRIRVLRFGRSVRIRPADLGL